jgi:hypothetical protein
MFGRRTGRPKSPNAESSRERVAKHRLLKRIKAETFKRALRKKAKQESQ